jgi:hypothetical protein
MAKQADPVADARAWQEWWDRYVAVLALPRTTEQESVRFGESEQSAWDARPVGRDFRAWHDSLPDSERRVLDEVIADRYRVAALSGIELP